MRSLSLLIFTAAFLVVGCKRSSSNKYSGSQIGLSAFAYSEVTEQTPSEEQNIVDLEFKVEEIVAYNKDGQPSKVALSPENAADQKLKDHLEGKSVLKNVWIPSGNFDYLEVRLQKWPIAVLQKGASEPINVVSRTLTRVLDRNDFSSSGEHFDIHLYTDQPLPLTTRSSKNIFAQSQTFLLTKRAFDSE